MAGCFIFHEPENKDLNMETTLRVLGALSIACLLTIAMTACHKKEASPSVESSPTSSAPPAPDYAQKESWLALPESPSVHEVDVLWFYPTVAHGEQMLMDYKDPELQEAARETISHQASVFSGSANLYVPYYRQLSRAGFQGNLETINKRLAYGQDDMWRAIEYYLEHYNNGRPFILAAHSQGSSNLLEIMKEKWGTTGKEKQLVAAYIIGWSITPQDIADNPNIRICEGATDTNCYITYNAVKDDMQGKSIQIAKGSWVTNPLSWESSTTDGNKIPASNNLGAVFFPAGKEPQTYPHFTSAQIKNSGLVCEISDPGALSPSSMPEGIYHRDDYSLFYENLKQNAKERIKAFKLKK